ncbi:NupC/NupG family nucleoside CNT transporter [Robertkochia sediminum]|uniref:NupC/NupG family nucleoside CNT transporter n=1 Tax=Robertkochia sediminum TaxID=2785326 RepID=UPI001F1C0365|nr:nucleoside transporter C-terminal domain-containing protein [Robertkochia sediminum]
MRTLLIALLALLSSTVIFSQELEKTWTLEDNTSTNIPHTIEFTDGDFEMLHLADTIMYKGNYFVQQNNLLLYFDEPADSTSRFKIRTLTDSTLTLEHKTGILSYLTNKPMAPTSLTEAPGLIPSTGLSMSSILRGALGMFVLIFIAWLFSNNRRAIRWKTVAIGLAAQLLLAVGVLLIPFVQSGFEWVGGIFVLILDFTKAGSEFLLGGMMDVSSYGFIFLFQILPTIIFFSALTSVLFYLGVIQIVVKGLAMLLSKTLGISGAESLSVAGNIFLGQTEAPLMIKAYLERMTRSEILLVMVGGMATVAGGVLAAYIGFLGGDDPELRVQFAKHLLAASVMAAPGAIVISKILHPQQQEVDTNVEVSSEKIGSNILDAIANGTTEGLRLAANVGAMLLVFIAFIAMINYFLNWVGGFTTLNDLLATHTPYNSFSLESILGIIFAPLMWAIGVAQEDIMLMGQLLGIKLAASEFVGYVQLAELKDASSAINFTYNKSVIMATYMLCGFANFASIGIQIGGIGSLAPGQRKTLSEFGLKAVLGGSLASLMSATIAGMIIG